MKVLRRRNPARIVVCSSGGVRNAGDDAILLRTVERIRALDPGAAIEVLTEEAGPAPVATVGTLTDRVGDLDLGGVSLVVVAGGGFANDWFGAHLAPRRILAERAISFNIPVITTGQGVGPLRDPTIRADLDGLVRASTAVSVRDRLSRDLLPHAHLTGDDALGLSGGESPIGAPALVLHLRHASYHSDDRDELVAWARAAQEVNDRVVGLAINDRPEAPEHATLHDAGIAHIVDATRDPRALVVATRDAYAVVAHSYHVALFALAAGVPTVLAAANDYYAAKAEGLQRLAEVSDALIAPTAPTAKELTERLEQVRADLRDNDALARAAKRVDEFFSAAAGAARPQPPGVRGTR